MVKGNEVDLIVNVVQMCEVGENLAHVVIGTLKDKNGFVILWKELCDLSVSLAGRLREGFVGAK